MTRCLRDRARSRQRKTLGRQFGIKFQATYIITFVTRTFYTRGKRRDADYNVTIICLTRSRGDERQSNKTTCGSPHEFHQN